MNLEDRLRTALADDQLALPSWPDATTRVRAGIRRRQRRAATIAAAVVAVAAVAATAPVLLGGRRPAQPAGPARPTPTASTAAALVPWLDQPVASGSPSPPASPPASAGGAPTARPCTAADLSPTAKTGPTNGAGGHILNVVQLTNASSSGCTLAGFPGLVATDVTSGTRATLHPRQGTFFDGAGDKLRPATIRPGEDAQVDIETGNGCNGGIGQPQRYREVTLVVAGRQYPVPGLTLQTWCPVAVGAWYTLAPEVTPSPSPRFAALSVQISAPASVALGGTLDYVVTLTNAGPVAVSLDPCPVYMQELWKNGGQYRLNCAPGEIPAGGSVRFAMRVTVATYTPLGPTKLLWTLQDSSASTTVTVTG